jgi:DNA-binding response OmpR family regulator
MLEDIVKALDNGATDYLTKPFRNAELQEFVLSFAEMYKK